MPHVIAHIIPMFHAEMLCILLREASSNHQPGNAREVPCLWIRKAPATRRTCWRWSEGALCWHVDLVTLMIVLTGSLSPCEFASLFDILSINPKWPFWTKPTWLTWCPLFAVSNKEPNDSCQSVSGWTLEVKDLRSPWLPIADKIGNEWNYWVCTSRGQRPFWLMFLKVWRNRSLPWIWKSVCHIFVASAIFSKMMILWLGANIAKEKKYFGGAKTIPFTSFDHLRAES